MSAQGSSRHFSLSSAPSLASHVKFIHRKTFPLKLKCKLIADKKFPFSLSSAEAAFSPALIPFNYYLMRHDETKEKGTMATKYDRKLRKYLMFH
jgi:hypothetical protein